MWKWLAGLSTLQILMAAVAVMAVAAIGFMAAVPKYKDYRRIWNGARVTDDAVAYWHVALIEKETSPPKLVCGGTLLGQNTILLAAHCFDRTANPANYEVLYGALNMDSLFAKRASVDCIATYEEGLESYNKTTRVHDIALIRITDSLPPSPVYPLKKSEQVRDEAGLKGRLLGWGVDKKGKQSRDLLFAMLNMEERSICEQKLNGVLAPGMVCIRGEDTSACVGDSGGGFTLGVNGSLNLVAIVSTGSACIGKPDHLGVYTRVSHYESWINGKRSEFASQRVCSQ